MAALLHADAHFVRGRDHTVCEDYALALPHAALLCDGCSASPHTDVGARLVAHAAAGAVEAAVRGELAWLGPAERARKALSLPSSALDCTCAVALCVSTGIDVALFGDGVVVARRTSGAIEVHEVIFDSGAPAYPAYSLSPERERTYRQAQLGSRRVESQVLGDASSPARPSATTSGPATRWHFPRADYDAVFLGSDGLSAFMGPDRSLIALEAVLPLVTQIRAPRGAFVRRRLRRLVSRDAHARGWYPSDDVAVAALCWAEAKAEEADR